MELEINKTYMIKHTEQIPTRIHQSDFIVEVSYRNRDGNYEYIGKEGLKFHFFLTKRKVTICIYQRKN